MLPSKHQHSKHGYHGELLSLSTDAAPDGLRSATQQFRSQVGHISRHSGVLFAGTIFSAALGYLFKVYLARVLGAEALGIYALGFTLVGFIGVFNSLGLVESAVRFAAVYRAANKLESLRSLLWRGGGVLLAVNVLFAAIFLRIGRVVALRFYHSPALVQYIPWFAALMLLGVISTFYGRILAGYKEVGRRTVINNFVGSPATMLLGVLLISLGWGLAGVPSGAGPGIRAGDRPPAGLGMETDTSRVEVFFSLACSPGP